MEHQKLNQTIPLQKENNMEIKVSWQSALIILMASIIIVLGAYYHRDYQLQVHVDRYNNTMQVLSKTSLTPQLLQVFRSIGYPLKAVQQLSQPVIEQGETSEEEGK